MAAMENWMARPARRSGDAAQQPATKVRATTATTDKGARDAVAAVGRLALETASRVRQLAPRLQSTVLVDKENGAVVEMIKVHQAFYATRGKNQGAATASKPEQNGQLQGSPHHHEWAAMVVALVRAGTGPKEDVAIVKEHGTMITAAEILEGKMLVCKAHIAPEAPKAKVILAVSDELQPVPGSVPRLLTSGGGEVKLGVAPRSAAERRAAKSPESLD